MRINKIKFISMIKDNMKTISTVKSIPVDTKFYKTLEFTNVEELNCFIGELLTLKEEYIKSCLKEDAALQRKRERRETKIKEQYEKYIRREYDG